MKSHRLKIFITKICEICDRLSCSKIENIHFVILCYTIHMTQEKLAIILKILRAGLSRILEDKLEAVYVYGSHARGDSRPDSDIDVLVVIRRDFDYEEILDQTIELVADLSLEFDVVISRAFVTKDRFDYEINPFLMNVRREAMRV